MYDTKTTVWLCSLVCAALTTSLGCDDPAERQARAEAKARAQAQAMAERAAAAEQTKKVEQDKEAQARAEEADRAEKARGALGACCTALARRGFEERNMKDMEAKGLCLDAETKGISLAAVRASLLTPVGERGLPPACLAD